MFEPLITQLRAFLLTGSAGSSDRQTIADLSLNLRVAAESVRAAQAALARAKAEQQQDRKRLARIATSIEDLENRARNALLKGLDPLAREAAEAIALLEDETDSTRKATWSR